MIKDKNIFECIFLKNNIHFPDYVIWGPPSHGCQRRKHIFKKAFPEMSSSISSSFRWKTLRKRHYDKRRLFRYEEGTETLIEINKDAFFTTAFGDPINIGDRYKGYHVPLVSIFYRYNHELESEILTSCLFRYSGTVSYMCLTSHVKS